MVDDWLAVAPDGRLLVRTGKVEIGQGITTALALIAAEELGVDPARVEVLGAVTGEAPDEGFTSGSNSVHDSGQAVRQACATARQRLLALAGETLGVAADELVLEDGLVRVRGMNRAASFRELVGEAGFAVAVDPAAPPVPARERRALGGKSEGFVDRRVEALVTGTARFVHDLQHPGMLHARVVRPPHYHARLEALEAHAVPDGVELVRDGSFVAVAAEDEFLAVRAAAALGVACRWRTLDTLPDADVFSALRTRARVSLPVVDGTPQAAPVPEVPADPPDTWRVLEATYERPYQMHGAIGPSAAMAELDGDTLTVWSHGQGIYPLRASLAEVLGLPVESVRVRHAPGSGCYGHNGADDAALDAALVAMRLPGRKVLLKWSRDDEHAWEPYAPCMSVSMRAAVAEDGRVLGWSHESFSDTHSGRPRPGPPGQPSTGGARLLAAAHLESPLRAAPARPAMGKHVGIHRNADPLYRFPGVRVVKHLVPEMGLRTSSLRTLGGFANVFAIESFMDEIARAVSADAFELRLRHLDDPRARAVLEGLREQIAGWPARGPGGTGRGIGFARYKNAAAYAAVGVEVEVGDDAMVRLRRAALVADAGLAVDPDGVAAQLEGGFLQAASWCLYEAVRFGPEGIDSRDWESYPILRFDNVPEIEVRLIDRPEEPPLGVGEASSGPAGAAIANAVFDASGLRLRRTPFTPDALRAAALED